MVRQILGTNKFVVYMYNGKEVRGKRIPKPKGYVYNQWGMIKVLDENGKEVKSKRFTDYGEMISFINKHMRPKVRENLKAHRTW